MIGVAEVAAVREAMAVVAARFDPAVLDGTGAAEVVRVAGAIKNMAATVQALAAARVAEGRDWESSGAKSAAEWLAGTSGTSVGQATAALATGRRLGGQDHTAAAARRGQLSAEQAAALAAAAAADPGAEARLVERAGSSSLTELREECLRTKAAADPDPDATHRRIHAERRLRFGTDAEGAATVSGRTTPDQLAPIKALVDRLTDERFVQARRAGEREPRQAYAMDALAEACRRVLQGEAGPAEATADGTSDGTGGGNGGPVRGRAPRVRYLGLIKVDVTALRRGWTEGDEVCEIAGVGPVPVAVAAQLLGDAALHVVITEGVDVRNVTSLARRPSVAMRMALAWAGVTCTVTGCNRPAAQIDHRADWARTHRTRLVDLDAYCCHHHDLKTYEGWGLVPGTGKRRMVPPDDPDHPGSAADRGHADAGHADAGRADAGRADAGRADAGRADAGRADRADRGPPVRAGP